MDDSKRDPPADDRSEVEHAYRQAVEYGRDLARIYTAEKARREELERTHQLLSAVFASTPDGIAVLDDSFVIQQANPAFCRLVERSVEDVIGRSSGDVLDVDGLIPALEDIAAGYGSPAQVDMTMDAPVKRSLLVSMARLEGGRAPQGWLLVLHDQSERKRLENLKAEFVNIAAHELRTPLTSIIGYVEMLEWVLGDDAMNEIDEYLVGIRAGGLRLKRIIEELIQFADLNEGAPHPRGANAFAVGEVVEQVLEECRGYADEHFVRLEFEPPAEPIRLVADPALVHTALSQLVLNAINFNRKEGWVRVTTRQIDDTIHVEVADSGLGIPQTELETIFQPFFQVEEHNTRRIGGLGLGLPIAHRVVTQLGGSIDVESTLGVGSTFTLRLPLQPPARRNRTNSD